MREGGLLARSGLAPIPFIQVVASGGLLVMSYPCIGIWGWSRRWALVVGKVAKPRSASWLCTESRLFAQKPCQSIGDLSSEAQAMSY